MLDTAEAAEEPIAEVSGGGEADADEGRPRKLTRKQQAELLRLQVDTVGQPGRAGERIQNVISVGMLSEGWDAKTVTHIMGLRAFTSQLLCEQVVGRGLRRTSYEVNPDTKLFEPEYVNVFGVPFTFLPHEGGENGPPPPPKPKTAIEPVAEKAAFEISWPNVVRIDHCYRPRLSLDWERVRPLELDAARTARFTCRSVCRRVRYVLRMVTARRWRRARSCRLSKSSRSMRPMRARSASSEAKASGRARKGAAYLSKAA